MPASLENETVFKKAFTDPTVFFRFVKVILGIDIHADKIETEKKFEIGADFRRNSRTNGVMGFLDCSPQRVCKRGYSFIGQARLIR